MLPHALKKGDTIGLFSPSGPISATVPVRYERGRDYLVSKGYKVREGKLTGKSDHYRSGSIKERAEELNELIRDPEVRCIMSTIGGYNSNSLLPYIDYGALIKDPKIIVGYSDVTAILLGIYERTGLLTFYGPAAAASFGEFPPLVDETWSYFSCIAEGKAQIPHVFPTPEAWTDEMIDWKIQDRAKNVHPNELITVRGGKATGRLIAGNLNTMDGIFGTIYMPEFKKGDILLIEDTSLPPAVIERSFSHLKLIGAFEKIGGLILGKHENWKDQGTGRRPYEILEEVMGDTDIPFLAEFDCCHTHPMLTLPIGAKVTLDATNKALALEEACSLP